MIVSDSLIDVIKGTRDRSYKDMCNIYNIRDELSFFLYLSSFEEEPTGFTRAIEIPDPTLCKLQGWGRHVVRESEIWR